MANFHSRSGRAAVPATSADPRHGGGQSRKTPTSLNHRFHRAKAETLHAAANPRRGIRTETAEYPFARQTDSWSSLSGTCFRRTKRICHDILSFAHDRVQVRLA